MRHDPRDTQNKARTLADFADGQVGCWTTEAFAKNDWQLKQSRPFRKVPILQSHDDSVAEAVTEWTRTGLPARPAVCTPIYGQRRINAGKAILPDTP